MLELRSKRVDEARFELAGGRTPDIRARQADWASRGLDTRGHDTRSRRTGLQASEYGEAYLVRFGARHTLRVPAVDVPGEGYLAESPAHGDP